MLKCRSVINHNVRTGIDIGEINANSVHKCFVVARSVGIGKSSVWFIVSAHTSGQTLISNHNSCKNLSFSFIIIIQFNLPSKGLPRTGYPFIVIVWLWSAVTIIKVSDVSVSSRAACTALSNWIASSNASFALPSWWAWSILPPVFKEQQEHTLNVQL